MRDDCIRCEDVNHFIRLVIKADEMGEWDDDDNIERERIFKDALRAIRDRSLTHFTQNNGDLDRNYGHLID